MNHYLRLRGVLPALAAAAVTVFAFSWASTRHAQVPVGVLTAPVAPSLPVSFFEPAALAIIHAHIYSRWPQLEQHAARRIRHTDLALALATATGMALALYLQGTLTNTSAERLLPAFLGYIGLAAVGRAWVGPLGWTLVLAFLTVMMVAGYDAGQNPAWWAWPLATDTRAVATGSAIALAAGLTSIAARGHRAGRQSGSEFG